jgi:hypothetical protein
MLIQILLLRISIVFDVYLQKINSMRDAFNVNPFLLDPVDSGVKQVGGQHLQNVRYLSKIVIGGKLRLISKCQ